MTRGGEHRWAVDDQDVAFGGRREYNLDRQILNFLVSRPAVPRRGVFGGVFLAGCFFRHRIYVNSVLKG